MEVTTALLADAAAIAAGKLYIHGAGWDQIGVQRLPSAHPAMAVVIVIRVEFNEALRPIPLNVVLLSEDEEPMGVEAGLELAVGHPPTQTHGAPTFAPLVIPLSNVQFERAGRYRFRVASGDRELASIPFEVSVAPRPPAPPTG
ncbi:MAG: hypothetical protein WD834_05195 [Actinomycetota bacterium]